MTEESSLPLGTRLWFAFVCFWRILFDGAFAARAFAARSALPAASQADSVGTALAVKSAAPEAPSSESALQLLALFQREGRFVDFIQQEIDGFSDAEVGAAARLVHRGCRTAALGHLEVAPIRQEPEGARLSITADYDADALKLTGNVSGPGPYSGFLRHRGWQVRAIRLPELVGKHDASIIAPAEVEL